MIILRRAMVAAVAVSCIAAGPSNTGGSVGCVKQWLSNGVWSARVTVVKPVTRFSGEPGIAVTINVRNDSSQTVSLSYSGVGDGRVELADGSTLDLDTDAVVDWHPYYYKNMRPGESFTHTLNYYSPGRDPLSAKPAHWVLDVNPKAAGGSAPHYSAKSPSFVVRLDCSSSSTNTKP